MKYLKAIILSLALMISALGSSVVAQEAPERSISHVAGDLYRFQNGAHVAVFLVTEEGIIATDPINAEAAAWLKAELSERFGVPVEYVLYSHSDADHTSGGEVFADTAIFVGHAKGWNVFDEQGHGPAPDIVYMEDTSVELGGQTVELIYPGVSHTDNLVVMNFPAERALFVVDIAAVRRLPFRTIPAETVPQLIAALKKVEQIDFDIFIGGHGPVGTKQDLIDHRVYIEKLVAAVTDARARGLSLEETLAEVKMEDYSDWLQYEAWLPLNIQRVYEELGGGE